MIERERNMRIDLINLPRGMDAVEHKFVALLDMDRPLNEYDAAWLAQLWKHYIKKIPERPRAKR